MRNCRLGLVGHVLNCFWDGRAGMGEMAGGEEDGKGGQ